MGPALWDSPPSNEQRAPRPAACLPSAACSRLPSPRLSICAGNNDFRWTQTASCVSVPQNGGAIDIAETSSVAIRDSTIEACTANQVRASRV
jgi:hypothetical protein